MLPTSTAAEFEINSITGFLPSPDPLTHLPPYFAPWDQLGANLPALLLAGQARNALDHMPLLDARRLEDIAQHERAMLLLSTFANAYVWAEPEPATRLPHNLSIPLWHISETQGRQPIISHASNVLQNWRRLDPTGGIALDNLVLLQPFLNSSDEAWFVLVTVEIEARGAPALLQLIRAQKAVTAGNNDTLGDALQHISSAIARMAQTLMRMYEKCDPYIFYHRVRPFFASWPTPGIIYEGISDTPLLYTGGSAGQSALVQALDAALSVRHPSAETHPYLADMRRYMPPTHRRFVETLEHGPDIRAFVSARQTDAPALADHYNRCIEHLSDFRKKHMEIAVRYITMQAPNPQAATGTGGTNFHRFLGTTKRETRERRLP